VNPLDRPVAWFFTILLTVVTLGAGWIVGAGYLNVTSNLSESDFNRLIGIVSVLNVVIFGFGLWRRRRLPAANDEMDR